MSFEESCEHKMSFLNEERNYIPRAELLEHVGISLLKDRDQPVPEIAGLSKANVQKRPLTIYDVNGKPLFYDYPLKRGAMTLGTVRAAASKVLGAPVVRYQLGESRLDLRQSLAKANAKVQREHRQARISRGKIVCYSYPKLGAMYEVRTGRDRERVIYDLSTLNRIQEAKPPVEREGAFAWSFYDSLKPDERKRRLEVFKKHDEGRLGAPERLRETLLVSRTLQSREILSYAEKLTPLFYFYYGRTLQFCSHYNDPFGLIMPIAPRKGHHCFILHAQEVDDYCAVATCQMILCYYRYYFSQDDIAPSLNYTAGSGCPADQSAGYESLTNNNLDATFDNSPTWEKVKDQIDDLKPMKSGVPGHARAVAGYQRSRFGGAESKMLYVYDPWPWDADLTQGGEVTWENWDSITHTNLIYTDLQY